MWSNVGEPLGGQLPLSAELEGRLRAWAACFNDHFDWEKGWNVDSAAIEAHAAEGHALHKWLIRELGEGYVVTLDLWQVPKPPPQRRLLRRRTH